MVIRFFGPFEKLAEKEIRIELKRTISTQDLLKMLASRYPGFASYSSEATDSEFSLTLCSSGMELPSG